MAVEKLDLNQIDEWAISLVVREGVRMNLNQHEQVVAAQQMKNMGMKSTEIADRLRCTQKDVEALWRRWERVGHAALIAVFQ